MERPLSLSELSRECVLIERQQSSRVLLILSPMAAALRRISGLFLSGHQNPRKHVILPPPHIFSSRGIASKLFVGGLSFYTTEETLSEAFGQFGQVVEAKIIMDRVSDRSKGFGFVTFASEDEAEKALTEMNGKILNGRVIFVDTAKVRPRFNDAVPIARGPP